MIRVSVVVFAVADCGGLEVCSNGVRQTVPLDIHGGLCSGYIRNHSASTNALRQPEDHNAK